MVEDERLRIERFEDTVTEFCEESSNTNLERRSLVGLLGDLRGFLRIRFHQWNNAALADTAAMVTYGLLGSFLRRTFPESKDAGLQNSLMKGIPGLVSGIPPLRLWELSRKVRANPRLLELFEDQTDDEVLQTMRTEKSFKNFQADIGDHYYGPYVKANLPSVGLLKPWVAFKYLMRNSDLSDCSPVYEAGVAIDLDYTVSVGIAYQHAADREDDDMLLLAMILRI